MRPRYQPTAAVAPAQERAHAAAALFGAGAVLGAVTLLVPGWAWIDRPKMWVVVVLAALTSLGLWRLGRLSVAGAHLVVTSGVVTISLLQILAGGGAATAANNIYYCWAAVYSFAMFSRPAALAQVGLMIVAQVVSLVVLGEAHNAPAQVTMSIGGALAVGVIVGSLVDRIRQLALLDSLTNLPNRRAAEEALLRAQADAGRTRAPMAVAVLDLDDFKQLNDTRGHAAGDRALQACARSWSAELRVGDLLARMGGDEFLAILGDCGYDQAREIATRLIGATPLPVRCSAGVAIWDGAETMDALLARADAALYVAKDRSGGQVAVDAHARQFAGADRVERGKRELRDGAVARPQRLG